VLISEATNHLAADLLETREIDSVVVVGKTEPQRIFELLGSNGEVACERLALRDAYVEALDVWQAQGLGQGACRVRDCLALAASNTADSPSIVERDANAP
jgi:adenylate cyclase